MTEDRDSVRTSSPSTLDRVRRAIEEDPRPGYVIAKEAGISQAHLSQLRRGVSRPSDEVISRLLPVLGLAPGPTGLARP